MSKAKLGDWLWHVGVDDRDSEMLCSGTREQALIDGRRLYEKGQRFYIVEARYRVVDEDAMANGTRDTAPFADERNGEWILA